jgi:phthiodiolone/phenolphthiodiolone dimycocerosates ketoreductase
MLAQAALTIDHLSKGRFILGLGSGETENTVPYGFDFSRPVSRFEEAIRVIELLWESDGPVDFEGRFFRLEHARLDTDLYGGRRPPLWIGANGPRMLEITGRHADGWWPAGAWTPEDYAAKLAVVRGSAERAGRDPMAIVPANVMVCLLGDDADLARIVEAPLVKAFLLQLSAAELRGYGYEHPMGEGWRGYQDIDPGALSRERIVDFLRKADSQALLEILPCGSPRKVAERLASYCQAGMRVFKILDYGGMAGLEFAAASAARVREAEDELLRRVEGA